MTEKEDKDLMEKFQITREVKVVYRYREYSYQSLKDALNYAKLEAERESLK